MAFIKGLPLPSSTAKFTSRKRTCITTMIRAPPSPRTVPAQIRTGTTEQRNEPSLSTSTVTAPPPVPITPSTPPPPVPIENPVSPSKKKPSSQTRTRNKVQERRRDIQTAHPVASSVVEHTERTGTRREYYYDDIQPGRPRRKAPVRHSETSNSQNPSLAPPELVTDNKKKTSKYAKDEKSTKITNTKATLNEDSVRSYLHEIGEVKLLDAEKEIVLARDIASLLELERVSVNFREEYGKDPSIPDWAAAANMDTETFRSTLRRGLRAKEHMVAANLRLVVSIAKKYLNRGLSFQDLIQEGSIGLIRGAEKFDGNKGFKFSTYATWWIRQAITRAIADHSRPIRLPVHVNDTIAAIRKSTKHLQTELNRPPTESEIADRMDITVEKLRFLAQSSRATVSLETPVARDGRDSNATLGSFIVWNGDTPEQSTMKSLMREDLESVLNTLSARERDVVRMRYGFDDGKMKTLEEIGTIFAVTRERIRQIEAKALRKLRHPNRNAVLREYVYEDQ